MKQTRTLSDLKPNKNNPRTISDGQLEKLKRSLLEFGDLSGFVVNKRTGNLVGGHQRQKALPPKSKIVLSKEYAKPTRTGTVQEGRIDVDGESFAFRAVDWPEDREIAANLAANEHGGEFDWQGVSVLLKSLEGKFDLALTGFPDHELENLLKAEWKPAAVGDLPANDSQGGGIDRVFLSVQARKSLDAVKAKLGEAEDAVAILKACEAFLL